MRVRMILITPIMKATNPTPTKSISFSIMIMIKNYDSNELLHTQPRGPLHCRHAPLSELLKNWMLYTV